MRVGCRLAPSLALVKYWGKREEGRNLPATPSLAVTLGGLETVTVVSKSSTGRDRVRVEGREVEAARYTAFFDEVRGLLGTPTFFEVESRNGFPGGAGFASSSSGFAALTLALARFVETAEGRPALPLPALSSLARLGSASAARAVYGGFSLLEAGAESAEPFFPASHWPELRIVAAVVSRAEKPVSSRSAMRATKETSPYYDEWLRDAPRLFARAKEALLARDLEGLGGIARMSYSRMHATALAADPPLLYWLPASVTLIHACAELRASGLSAWETMDAGPQVKVLCLASELEAVKAGLRRAVPGIELLVAAPGPEPVIFSLEAGQTLPAPGSGLA